jgi:hypothetical protein
MRDPGRIRCGICTVAEGGLFGLLGLTCTNNAGCGCSMESLVSAKETRKEVEHLAGESD